MNKSFKKTAKDQGKTHRGLAGRARERHIKFAANGPKRDKTIQEYLRLFKLTKTEYQKLLHKNKTLKEKIEAIEKQRKTKKEKKR